MKRMLLFARQALVVLLALALILEQGIPSGTLAQGFADTVGNAYEESIKFMKDQNVMTGHGDGLFHGDWNLERAQLLVTYFRLTGIPIIEPTEPCFTDVPPGLWFSGPVCTAALLNLVQGFEDGSFGPGIPVDVAQALDMAEKIFGWDLSLAADEPLPPHIPEDAWFAPLYRYVKKFNLLPPEVLGMQPYEIMKRDFTAETMFRSAVTQDKNIDRFDESTRQSFLENTTSDINFRVTDVFEEVRERGPLRGAAPAEPVVGFGVEPPDAVRPAAGQAPAGDANTSSFIHDQDGFVIEVEHPRVVQQDQRFTFDIAISGPEGDRNWKLHKVDMDRGFLRNLKTDVAEVDQGPDEEGGLTFAHPASCVTAGEPTVAKFILELQHSTVDQASVFALRPIQLDCVGNNVEGGDQVKDGGQDDLVLQDSEELMEGVRSIADEEFDQSHEEGDGQSHPVIVALKSGETGIPCIPPQGEVKITAFWKMIDKVAGSDVTDRFAATIKVLSPGGTEKEVTIKSRRGGARVSELELTITALAPGVYTFSLLDVGFATDEYHHDEGFIITVYDLKSNQAPAFAERKNPKYKYDGDEAKITVNLPQCEDSVVDDLQPIVDLGGSAGSGVTLFDGFGQYSEASNAVIARWFLKVGDTPLGNTPITVVSQATGESLQTHQLTTDSTGLAILQLFNAEPGKTYIFRLTHVDGGIFETVDANEAIYQQFNVTVPGQLQEPGGTGVVTTPEEQNPLGNIELLEGDAVFDAESDSIIATWRLLEDGVPLRQADVSTTYERDGANPMGLSITTDNDGIATLQIYNAVPNSTYSIGLTHIRGFLFSPTDTNQLIHQQFNVTVPDKPDPGQQQYPVCEGCMFQLEPCPVGIGSDLPPFCPLGRCHMGADCFDGATGPPPNCVPCN